MLRFFMFFISYMIQINNTASQHCFTTMTYSLLLISRLLGDGGLGDGSFYIRLRNVTIVG
jgi:hypothetical protein